MTRTIIPPVKNIGSSNKDHSLLLMGWVEDIEGERDNLFTINVGLAQSSGNKKGASKMLAKSDRLFPLNDTVSI